MKSILPLLLLALGGPLATAKNDVHVVADCHLELVAHAAAESERFLALADLGDALAGRVRATLLVRLHVPTARRAHLEKDLAFVNSPGLSAPLGLRRFEDEHLSFVLDGGVASLGQFAARLARANLSASVGLQILDSKVKDLREIELTSASQYARLDSSTPEGEATFAALAGSIDERPEHGLMVDDVGAKVQYDVYGAGAVQRILDSRALAKLAGIRTTNASRGDTLAAVVARSRQDLAGETPVAIRYGSVFLVNTAASLSLLELKGRLAPAKPRASVHVSSELRSLLKSCLADSPRGVCLDPPRSPAPAKATPSVAAPAAAAAAPEAAPAGRAYPRAQITPPHFGLWPIERRATDPVGETAAAPAPAETPVPSVERPSNLPGRLTHDGLISPARRHALGKVRANIEPMMMIAEKSAELMARPENRLRARIASLTEAIEGEIAKLEEVEAYYLEETDPDLLEILISDHATHVDVVQTYQDELERALAGGTARGPERVFLEISRVGGAAIESEIPNLTKMYSNLARRRGWTFEEVETSGDKYGPTYATLVLTGEGVSALLATERGTHRFIGQHLWSGKTLTVMYRVSGYQESSVAESKFNENDFEVTTMRSSGAGGQHVNTTDSAVRVIHKATKVSAKIGLRRSQSANKDLAFSIVLGKLRDIEETAARERLRSERNAKSEFAEGRYQRTYDQRAKDHPSMDVLFGNGLERVLDEAQRARIERRLQELADSAPQV